MRVLVGKQVGQGAPLLPCQGSDSLGACACRSKNTLEIRGSVCKSGCPSQRAIVPPVTREDRAI